MAAQNNHIINKQTLKIQVGDMAAATTVNQGLQQWLQAEMPRVLNDLLDDYAGDETVYIDRLELSLDFKNISDFNSRFLNEFKQQLQKQLARQTTTASSPLSNTVLPVQKANAGKSSWETLLFYLQNGTFPWWFNDENHTRLLQDVFDQWENTAQQKK
ncbi:contractile injection system tape measure protein [Oscillatoria amoena NRMC-F 0135]|nr:contractile injection system tape measure protein [Oscillatoria amoena NRMC-F 0135]